MASLIPSRARRVRLLAGAVALLSACQGEGEPKRSTGPALSATSTTSAPAAPAASAKASAESAKASAPRALDDKIFEGLPARTVAGRITDASGQPVKDVVVYIKGAPAGEKGAERGAAAPPVIDQKEKTFLPPVLPVVVGTRVDFKNSDPLLHNAYSRSKTKAFDLGAFSSKETKSVVFDTPGRVDVFCAIHTNMHAVILVLDTPHFALTDAEGAFRIAKAPAGKRKLVVWHELNGEEEVAIEVPEERALVVKRAIAYRAPGAGAVRAP